MRPGPLQPAPFVGVPRVLADEAQRAKVAELGCAVCGRVPVDPAHLVPQRPGGCGSPDCVIALCRTHHRLYDSARLALAPHLTDAWEPELRHAVGHVGVERLGRALGGRGWPAPWIEKRNERGTEP